MSKKLPVSFLKGCGLSDLFIDNIPKLLEKKDLNKYCFLAHSTKDQVIAEKLHSDLQNHGVRVWLSPLDLNSFFKAIGKDDINRLTDNFLVIISENSIDSRWLRWELGNTFRKSKEAGEKILYPLSTLNINKIKDWKCVDPDSGTDISKQLREYNLLNFEKWKDPAEYKKSFNLLLRTLTETKK